MTKAQEESNNNDKSISSHSGPPTRHKRNRMKKRMSTLLHTHVALIILTICAVLDAGCVIGQIIADILIMKDELHEKEILEASSKDLLFKTFPDFLNKSVHGAWSLQSILVLVQNNVNGHSHSDGSEHLPIDALVEMARIPTFDENDTNPFDHSHDDGHSHDHDHGHFHSHARVKRGAGGNHKHDLLTDAAMIRHYMLHELTHAFHLGSMVILTLLVLITFFKMFVMGKKFLHHKIEVFDAFVITVSWCLDLVFWEGLWAHPEDEAANIMIFILPWRVIRVVNSFVLVIQGRDLLQLKIVKQQYRGSVKRASDLKMKTELYRVEVKNLQALCKKKGATEKDIKDCAPTGGRRRRSSLLPVLSRLASIGSTTNSTIDLIKEPPTPNESDDEDYMPVALSWTCSRQSSTSDNYSLARTISNMSTASSVSTIPVSPRQSLGSMIGEDNPVFYEDSMSENPHGTDTNVYTKL